jgi:isoquinoline 1-oxidoreductase alpha subunit
MTAPAPRGAGRPALTTVAKTHGRPPSSHERILGWISRILLLNDKQRRGEQASPNPFILMEIDLNINGSPHSVDVDPSKPLLWVLRDDLGLVGTKYGCGRGLCGSCTVHLDGSAARSCLLPVGTLADRAITTIEGLGDGPDLHPLQEAWIKEDVPQCGYCQAGQIMTAAALLKRNATPTAGEIDAAMRGNLCRCGTYVRIRRAIQATANGGMA